MSWNTNDNPSEHDALEKYRDASRGERLQRVMSKGGVASRRKCEEMIENGDVKVNGEVINFLPAWVNPMKDRITIANKKLNLHADDIYVMYYKPRGIVCTMSDPEGRPCVGEIVSHHTGHRIFPIGRLDMESQGLLLLTNDQQLTHALTHPSHQIGKTYEVTVRGNISESTIAKLQKGVYISDTHTRHDGRKGGKRANIESIELVKHDRDRSVLKIVLTEGRNRQIRRMLALVGHPVKRLRRTHIGNVQLKGLRPGQWRDLIPTEITELKKSLRLG